jgi:polygalacturonase
VSGYKVGSLLDGTKIPNEKQRNGRIKFGTESSGGFRNCKITDCTFYSCMGLAIEEVDGGIAENISFDNIKIYDAQNYGIYIVTGKRNRTPNLTTNSRMKNIRISNVLVEGVDKMSGIQIFGLPEQPLENIYLSNITIKSNGGGTVEDAARVPKELGTGYPDPNGKPSMPAYGIYARHIKGLEMNNITFSYKSQDMRSAAIFMNVDGLKLNTFKAQVTSGAKVAEFKEKVTNVKITNSPDVKQ